MTKQITLCCLFSFLSCHSTAFNCIPRPLSHPYCVKKNPKQNKNKAQLCSLLKQTKYFVCYSREGRNKGTKQFQTYRSTWNASSFVIFLSKLLWNSDWGRQQTFSSSRTYMKGKEVSKWIEIMWNIMPWNCSVSSMRNVINALVNLISEYWSCFYRKLLSLYLLKSRSPVHKSVGCD